MGEGQKPINYNWVLFESVVYLRGKGISFGDPLLQPNATNQNVYSINIDTLKTPRTAGIDQSLEIFGDGSLDHIYIGPRVEMLQDPFQLIREAQRKLKIGGHLLVDVKIGNHEPGVFEFQVKILMDIIEKIGKWKVKVYKEKDGRFLFVGKKLKGTKGLESLVPIKQSKSVCICRYGAFGDAIIMTPLVRKFKEDGYHVTLNITTYCSPIFEQNPFVDNIIIQERDAIPNQMLGEYWEYWKGRYTKYINLSESLEGDLLQVEGRPGFFSSQNSRHSRCDKNYYDYTFEKAGYLDTKGLNGELFFTSAEHRKMDRHLVELEDKFKILWALNGSSHHKVYPLMETCMEMWLQNHPDSVLITVGDYVAKLLEFDHPQTIHKAGDWSIRESLLATSKVDLVIGPETAVLNASGCFDTPKICLLSHSSHFNLCHNWKNDYSLEPNKTIAPCYPCHQLHYTKESCPQGIIMDNSTNTQLTEGPVCAMGAIEGQRLLDTIEIIYQKWLKGEK